MQTRIRVNWNWVRIVRLLIGLAAITQGLLQQEWVLIAAGLLVAAMAILNWGCCGNTGCAIMPRTKTKNKEDIYEEVDG